MTGKRTFKIVQGGKDDASSRLLGSTPKQAANKAFTSILRQQNKTTCKKMKFAIQETTQNSKKKVYTYTGERVKLKTPLEYDVKTKDGETRTIVIKYKNIVKSFKS